MGSLLEDGLKCCALVTHVRITRIMEDKVTPVILKAQFLPKVLRELLAVSIVQFRAQIAQADDMKHERRLKCPFEYEVWVMHVVHHYIFFGLSESFGCEFREIFDECLSVGDGDVGGECQGRHFG